MNRQTLFGYDARYMNRLAVIGYEARFVKRETFDVTEYRYGLRLLPSTVTD
jgi:hypothetical protein